MSVRSVFRYVDYVSKPDPDGERTWRAVCASSDDEACGAKSPESGSEQAVTDWMAEHRAETGHNLFERVYTDYAIVEPKT